MMRRVLAAFAFVLSVCADDARTISDWRWLDSSGTSAPDKWGQFNATGTNVTMTSAGWLFATSRYAIATGVAVTNPNCTIEAWIVKTNVSTVVETVYSEGNTGTVTPYCSFGISGGSNMFFDLRTDGSVNMFAIATNNLRDGAMHHICAVKSGSNFTGYVDGNLQISGNLGGAMTLNARRIGSFIRTTETNFFNGTIKRVRITGAALNAAEVAERSMAGVIDQ